MRSKGRMKIGSDGEKVVLSFDGEDKQHRIYLTPDQSVELAYQITVMAKRLGKDQIQ